MKAASKAMVERMIRKAELVDAGVLQAMFDEKGKLTTLSQNDRRMTFEPTTPAPNSPGTFQSVYGPNGINLRSPSHSSNRQSAYGRQSSYYPPNQQGGNGLAIEMPGDTQYHANGAHLHPNDQRNSAYSELSGNSPQPPNGRWSGVQSDAQSSNGSEYSRPTHWSAPEPMRSPMMNPSKSFAAELPGSEIAAPTRSPNPQGEERQHDQSGQGYQYNPQDYANMQSR